MDTIDGGGLSMALAKDALFVAMTRPAMAFGVPLGGVLLNALIGLELFLITHHFVVLTLVPLVHLYQWRLCQQDARVFELLSVWLMLNVLSHRVPWACKGAHHALDVVSSEPVYMTDGDAQ